MSLQYSLSMLQEDVQYLLQKGLVSRSQPIYTLCKFVRSRDWDAFERELEANDFLLRDRIGDLVPREFWSSD